MFPSHGSHLTLLSSIGAMRQFHGKQVSKQQVVNTARERDADFLCASPHPAPLQGKANSFHPFQLSQAMGSHNQWQVPRPIINLKETKRSIQKTQGLIAQGPVLAGTLQASSACGTGSLNPKCPWISKEGEWQNERGPWNCQIGEAPAGSDWAKTTAMFIQLTAFIFLSNLNELKGKKTLFYWIESITKYLGHTLKSQKQTPAKK